MPIKRHVSDYESVTPANATRRLTQFDEGSEAWASLPLPAADDAASDAGDENPPGATATAASRATQTEPRTLKRGHMLSYAGLFLFTCVLYLRPYELIAALSSLTSLAFWVAVATLLVFFPTQFVLEGNLTARPREVTLVLLLILVALVSIPLAIDRGLAWETFTGNFIKAHLMFLVIVNAVRTERRLKWLLLLALAVGCFLSIGALQDYQYRNLITENFRVAGRIGGMFENPNELGINLVYLLPIAVALMLSTRSPVSKLVYGSCVLLIFAAVIVTFSRGSFLGMSAAAAVFAWKIRRRNKFLVGAFVVFALLGLLVLVPGGYADRLLSIVDHSRDQVGSASARQTILLLSIKVMLRHPLLGVGLRNFEIVSIHGLVTHNAYTQVGTEMGIPAMIIFLMLFLYPYKRLREVERETFAAPDRQKFYYLAVGLQAALAGYMVNAFFISSAYQWYTYYLVGYAVCLRRIYRTSPSPVHASLVAPVPPGAHEASAGHLSAPPLPAA